MKEPLDQIKSQIDEIVKSLDNSLKTCDSIDTNLDNIIETLDEINQDLCNEIREDLEALVWQLNLKIQKERASLSRLSSKLESISVKDEFEEATLYDLTLIKDEELKLRFIEAIKDYIQTCENKTTPIIGELGHSLSREISFSNISHEIEKGSIKIEEDLVKANIKFLNTYCGRQANSLFKMLKFNPRMTYRREEDTFFFTIQSWDLIPNNDQGFHEYGTLQRNKK